MIYGGKSKYSSLLTLIRHESPRLYDLISDLCLDGTFRSQRYQNTFLMPGKELVAHIDKLVEADKDVEAIDIIRSLMLKGHLTKDSFKKDANIGTLQFGSHVLADPVAVGKEIADSKKSVIATKEGAHATVVYEYTGSAPKTGAGKSGGLVLVGKVSGGAIDGGAEKVREITKQLIVDGNACTTVNNFFKAVVGALVVLEKKDTDCFKKAKFYLAANPILSWFFLTMPGRSDALLDSKDLADFHWKEASDFDIIKRAEKAGEDEHKNYSPNKELLVKIKGHRSQLVSSDKSSLIDDIKKVYKTQLEEAYRAGGLDEMLSKNVELKMIMDEMRFAHENAVVSWSDVDDAITSLGATKWHSPADSLTILDPKTYQSCIKGNEVFMSGPVTFVRSIYFMYVPLTEAIEEQLMRGGKGGGSVIGGNPATINNVVFTGGAARKQMKAADIKLASLVRMLSKAQCAALKEML